MSKRFVCPNDMLRSSSRRGFLRSTLVTAAAAGGAISLGSSLPPLAEAAGKRKKVVIAAHPWVYAAPISGYDITPVLDQIFSDMSYAGIDAIEMMHEALRHPDSVERIGELSHKHSLPVLGASFTADMWDPAKHGANLRDRPGGTSRCVSSAR